MSDRTRGRVSSPRRSHLEAFELAADGDGPPVRPYERSTRDPVYRPLRVLTANPALAGRASAVAVINVPWEPLRPGPVGALFEVIDFDETRGETYPPVDLDDPRTLMEAGVEPAPADPRFHQQTVYAVCSSAYAAFCAALGRTVLWAFRRRGDSGARARLRIRPHAFEGEATYYDPEAGELCFGYYTPSDEGGRGPRPPRGESNFACLSPQVVVHELTHALVHGVRPRLAIATGEHVLGFHEGFADLVSAFHHFSSASMVGAAVRRLRLEGGGADVAATYVQAIARHLADWPGAGLGLRQGANAPGGWSRVPETYFTPGSGGPEAGALLVSAVFEAFAEAFQRKIRRHVMLATGETGVLPKGGVPTTLDEALAVDASKVAGQFLAMCVRALDYCPPVDIDLGDFLRAVITADRELVPDDRLRFRELWIEAFRRRGIYPHGVVHMTEDALLWNPPPQLLVCEALAFGAMRFQGDPRYPAHPAELRRQMEGVGRLVSDPALRTAFGLVAAADPGLRGDTVTLPVVEQVRTTVRVGPDGQVMHLTVTEVGQRRTVRDRGRAGGPTHDVHGGATIVLGPRGDVRYIISKSVVSEERLERERSFPGRSGSAFPLPRKDAVPVTPAVDERLPTAVPPRLARPPVDPFTREREREIRSAGDRPRHRLFVSYARENTDWLRRLRTALRPLERDFDLTIWDDTEIRAGDEWEKAIDSALTTTTLAILLVSPEFIDSEFIADRELPALLRAAERGVARLLCVAVSSVLADRLPVAKFQWLNTPERPLDLFSVPEQNREFVGIARQIAELLDDSGHRLTDAAQRGR